MAFREAIEEVIDEHARPGFAPPRLAERQGRMLARGRNAQPAWPQGK